MSYRELSSFSLTPFRYIHPVPLTPITLHKMVMLHTAPSSGVVRKQQIPCRVSRLRGFSTFPPEEAIKLFGDWGVYWTRTRDAQSILSLKPKVYKNREAEPRCAIRSLDSLSNLFGSREPFLPHRRRTHRRCSYNGPHTVKRINPPPGSPLYPHPPTQKSAWCCLLVDPSTTKVISRGEMNPRKTFGFRRQCCRGDAQPTHTNTHNDRVKDKLVCECECAE